MPGTISSPCLYDVLYRHVEAILAGAAKSKAFESVDSVKAYQQGRIYTCEEILRFMTTIKDMVIAPVPPPPPEPEVCKHCGKVNGCPVCSVHPADL